jgi:aspartyl-tRNA(Asn)/glutamyl-tRNA(Gln) amidotransferase subunit C
MSKKLDSSTVKKIAQLAKLSSDPSPEFLDKYGEELGAILEYVDQLQEVDTSDILPTDGLRTIKIADLREDNPPENQENYDRIRVNIISNFPTKNGVLLELPGIFVAS